MISVYLNILGLKGGSKVFIQTSLTLGAMALVFILTLRLFKMPPELSMIISAFVGALVAGFGLPLRHIVEGAYTYLDIILTIIAATIFMNILKESGAIFSIVRSMVVKFYKHRLILLILLMLVLLLPGALTGAGSVSVLISGGIVAMVLGYMGISLINVSAIVFIGAALSITAPPVNIYAMIISGGVNMPYIGFFIPLAIPVLILAIFSVLFLGWQGKPLELNEIINKLPQVSSKMTGLRVYLPLIVLACLMLSTRLFPHILPILGLPFVFLISAVVALFVIWISGEKVNIFLML
jgi:CitMHS family citrate-Mg2+:H+ or citrate-Ca2+:H+ symporter